MAYGCPVIAARIERLLADAGAYETMSAAASNRVFDVFDYRQHTKDVIDTLAGLAGLAQRAE